MGAIGFPLSEKWHDILLSHFFKFTSAGFLVYSTLPPESFLPLPHYQFYLVKFICSFHSSLIEGVSPLLLSFAGLVLRMNRELVCAQAIFLWFLNNNHLFIYLHHLTWFQGEFIIGLCILNIFLECCFLVA